ncbi:hypothetical protein [Pinibacter soli]|uniref:Wadjet protein JetD C-terminal domain-containing protein n=1 Tax=Pinibacter soli TaxID=3044211 RepID=A0ABT6RHV7_9BACT|nr:hypothetical protein [Pinibacter soli]MDI3321407.1 hypothetical protein [Pinibacter soli]
MNWQTFKSLHELYETGKTKKRPSLAIDAVFKYHTAQTKELLFTKKDVLVKNKALFDQTFRNRYLNEYDECQELLNSIDENTPQCRFEVEDILCLQEMKRQMDNGEFEDIRKQIIDSNETRRGVSLMFFKHEKHLDSREALERAVRKILQIEQFADNRDFQYLYVLQCHDPKVIVLCENLYFLKMPEKARKRHIELWYAGGRNIEKLIYTESRELPIYYLCDWDHDGLDIYEAVKEKIPHIQLLTPNGTPRDIVKTEHKSLWRFPETPAYLSGLNKSLFSDEQKYLIEALIRDGTWIVEESNDIVGMIGG